MLKLNNKTFFLTYSQCSLILESLLDGIKLGFHEHCQGRRVTKYVVAHEEHKDGGSHRHVFVDLDRPFRGQVPADFLDVEGHHPNLECVRSNAKVLAYCTKEGKYITNMEINQKVTKEDIARRLMRGDKLVDIVQESPKFLFGYSRLKADIQLYELDRNKVEALDRTCGLWISGPSGCGKSTIATGLGNYYFKDKNKWWDGYNGEENVLLEDVDLSWKEVLPYFKIWADRYPFNAEVKGGTISIRPKRVVVTSNRTLTELLELMGWPKDDFRPYERRFSVYWITSIADWENQQ